MKPWQFDPTKWIVWTLSKVGLISDLRRVPDAKILLAEMQEAKRQVESKIELHPAHEKLQEMYEAFNKHIESLQAAVKERVALSQDVVKEGRQEIRAGMLFLKSLARSRA